MAELVLTPAPIILPYYGFSDFLQLFLLGDTSRLLAASPRGEASFVGEDTVKTTMLLQAIRRLPILTAIPLSLTIVLFVATFAKAFVPLVSHLLPHSKPPHPKKEERIRREIVELDEESWLLQLTDHVDTVLENLQQEVPVYEEGGEDGEPLKSEQSAGVQDLVELGDTLNRLLDASVNAMPAFGSCVGAMIGCAVRLNFIGTACLPFAPTGACAGLLGTTIKRVLTSFEGSGGGFS